MSSLSNPGLEERLAAYPQLRERIEKLVDVMENSAGDVILADEADEAEEAERRVIEEVRQMGQDVLQGWAEHGVEQAVARARSQETAGKGNGKKTPVADNLRTHNPRRAGAIMRRHGGAPLL